MNRIKHIEYPDISLHEMLKISCEKYPNNISLEYYSKKITYRRLMQQIDCCAKSLIEIGVVKGENVSVILPNIPQAIIVFYAINKIGAIASMIHPLSTEKEISYYVNLTHSKVIIALDMISEKLKNFSSNNYKVILTSPKDELPISMKVAYQIKQRKVYKLVDAITWKQFIKYGEDNLNSIKSIKGSVAVILYSGGTTGKPKGIILTNLNFNALALQSIHACGCLKSKDRVLSVMPIFHGFGLGVCIHTVFTFGGTAIILPQFKTSNFYKLVLKYKPNVIAGVPSIYEYILRSNGFKNRDLSFIKCIIYGDALSQSTKNKLDAIFLKHGCHATIREGYGLTECVTGTCLMPENSNKVGSVGLPYADTFYKIIDTKSNKEVPNGEKGEIILRGPTVMMGYLNSDETKTALKYRDDGFLWLYTGDMGYKDNDGYIYFSQRLKRIIISNGYNIYAQNIENEINSHKDVIMCAVVGVHDEIRGQKVKAFIIPKDNVDHDILKAEIEELCRKNIVAYAIPKFEFRKSLPRTLIGKIAYTELSKTDSSQ